MIQRTVLSCLVPLSLVACTGDGADTADSGPDQEALLEEARAATEAYADVGVALDDGYVSTFHYVAEDEVGGMGVHFVNEPLMAEPLDHTKPHVLLYDVADDGTYELAALEWFVPAEAVDSAPSLLGQTFDGPMEGHEEGQPEHYDLHAWVHVDNPAGTFAPLNPELEPPSWWADLETAWAAAQAWPTPTEATSAGYESTHECVSNPQGEGAMGVHWVDESATGIAADHPHVLMYHDMGAGEALVGVEWFVPSSSVTEAPELFGQTFDGPMPGHDTGQPEHYELHAWIGAVNPDGIFAGFNPALDCPSE